MIGIRELRRDLATYIRRASAGTTLVVSVDGRPVAQITSLTASEGVVDLDALVAAGALVAPRRVGVARSARSIPVPQGTRLDRVLQEVRG